MQTPEVRAVGLELFDDGEEMTDGAGEAVQPDHDQGFAGLDFAKQSRQYGPGSIGPGRVFLKEGSAA
jgi:hypothetical protein